jgi:hypothetical protein
MNVAQDALQNVEGSLCHNILTGKVLPPAPVDVPKGDLTLWLKTDADMVAEGFTFVWKSDEWYEGDVDCIGCDGVTVVSSYDGTDAATFPTPIFPGDDLETGDSAPDKSDKPLSA